MKKCYKVVRRKSSGRLISCTIPDLHIFCREYSTDTLVDMGMVFKSLIRAKYFAGWHNEIWEAQASWLELVKFDIVCDYDDMILMQEFWKSHSKTTWKKLSNPPEGTYMGFDIRLIRRAG